LAFSSAIEARKLLDGVLADGTIASAAVVHLFVFCLLSFVFWICVIF
jgi:hypothetical protein